MASASRLTLCLKGAAKCESYANSRWTIASVKKVLTAEVYLGHMVQGRKRSGFSEGKKPYYVPESEWVIVRDTHEPLVSISARLKACFAAAISLLASASRLTAFADLLYWRTNLSRFSASATACGQFKEETALTEAMAHALIDRVEIDGANRVSITLRYRDEYNALLRLLAAEGEAVSA